MGEWRDILVHLRISFREPEPAALGYWILAEETCLALSFPYRDGEILPRRDRSVQLIERLANAEAANAIVRNLDG